MKDIKYALRGVTLNQFAKLFEPSSDNIEISISIPVEANYANRTFAVGTNIKFLENDKPFLVAELFCHYEIEQECWNELSAKCTKGVSIPKDLMNTLARISISTIRGAICAKTENTPYAKYYLPIIEFNGVKDGEDFIITKI